MNIPLVASVKRTNKNPPLSARDMPCVRCKQLCTVADQSLRAIADMGGSPIIICIGCFDPSELKRHSGIIAPNKRDLDEAKAAGLLPQSMTLTEYIASIVRGYVSERELIDEAAKNN